MLTEFLPYLTNTKFLFPLNQYIAIFLYNTSLSQSDPVQWNKLFKHHDNIEIIYDDYLDKFWISQYSSPLIIVDTVIVLEPKELSTVPSPIEGLEKLSTSVKYPEIARLAGFEGKVILIANIDTLGNPVKIEVKLSDAEIFNNAVTETIKGTKFIPAYKNGKSIEAKIAIAFSFVLKQKKNIQIDTIIVDKSVCLGNCPSYTITLCKNGEVIYDGRYYVDKLGKWKSTLSKNEFEGITSLIFAIDFFNKNEIYSTNASDFPWVTITVISNQLIKKVKTDFYVPLWELARLVDCLTEVLDWEEIEE